MSRWFVAPEESSGFYFILFSLFLTWWVGVDRVALGFSVPFEYDVLVYFAWPLMVPYYLYRTRGWKGILFGLGIWGLCAAPVGVAATVTVFLHR
jgi:hypothetical protein